MSEPAEPAEPFEYEGQAAPDADAWATACEEDLAAEKARRRAEYGPQYGSAAEELRRLADAVSGKVAELGKPFAGTLAASAAQSVAQQFIAQARAAVEPVVERNPQVFDHLAAAGGELLAAYRAAVQEAEGRWTAGAQAPPQGPPGTPAGTSSGTSTGTAAGAPGSASADLERIDLDKEPEETAGPGRDEGDRGNGPRDSAGSGGAAGSAGSSGPGEAGESGSTGNAEGSGGTGDPEAPGGSAGSRGSEDSGGAEGGSGGTGSGSTGS
jgi:hypothetical protein